MMDLSSGHGTSPPILADELLERARAATGLSDFGDPWFMAPLTRLVAFLNGEARLTSNEAMPVQVITGCLIGRLQLVDWLKKNPAVHDERLDVAGVIIGLARGGSTLAQRLLGSAPQLTSTYAWEVASPLPLQGEIAGDPSLRIARVEESQKATAALWPELASMHPLSATSMEEEIGFFDRGFISIMYFFYAYLPSYSSWQWAQDHTKVYEELALWLKVLQYQTPVRRRQKWLLKSPQHLLGGGLRTLIKTFPDAKILMTHRTLESVISSFCSLQYIQLKTHTHDLDRRVLGPQAMDLFEHALRHLIDVRAEHPADRFVDIQYTQLVADPLGEFRRVMEAMGLTVTADDMAAATAWMANNARDTHPRHRYAPEDSGIDRAELARRFQFYHDAFLTAPATQPV